LIRKEKYTRSKYSTTVHEREALSATDLPKNCTETIGTDLMNYSEQLRDRQNKS